MYIILINVIKHFWIPTVALQNEGDCDGDSNESKIVESSVDPEFLFEDADENMAMQALDGFLLVLSNDGDIIYVSENIHDYVGIQQASSLIIYSVFHVKTKNWIKLNTHEDL